jgi:predicted DNA-binding transcriptional regulator YafY
MKVQEVRPGVFNATFSAHELSVLLAGARMSLSLMDTDPQGSTERARSALESVLAEFDAALARARGQGPERTS